MKTIEIKSGKIGGSEINTIELIRQVLSSVPGRGFTYHELKKRNRIERAIEKQGSELNGFDSTIVLEDADYNHLKGLVLNQDTWQTRSEFVFDFIESFDKNGKEE